MKLKVLLELTKQEQEEKNKTKEILLKKFDNDLKKYRNLLVGTNSNNLENGKVKPAVKLNTNNNTLKNDTINFINKQKPKNSVFITLPGDLAKKEIKDYIEKGKIDSNDLKDKYNIINKINSAINSKRYKFAVPYKVRKNISDGKHYYYNNRLEYINPYNSKSIKKGLVSKLNPEIRNRLNNLKNHFNLSKIDKLNSFKNEMEEIKNKYTEKNWQKTEKEVLKRVGGEVKDGSGKKIKTAANVSSALLKYLDAVRRNDTKLISNYKKEMYLEIINKALKKVNYDIHRKIKSKNDLTRERKIEVKDLNKANKGRFASLIRYNGPNDDELKRYYNSFINGVLGDKPRRVKNLKTYVQNDGYNFRNAVLKRLRNLNKDIDLYIKNNNDIYKVNDLGDNKSSISFDLKKGRDQNEMPTVDTSIKVDTGKLQNNYKKIGSNLYKNIDKNMINRVRNLLNNKIAPKNNFEKDIVKKCKNTELTDDNIVNCIRKINNQKVKNALNNSKKNVNKIKR